MAAGLAMIVLEGAATYADCAATSVAAPLASRSLLLDGADTGSSLVVVGDRGHVLVSTDQGASWKQSTVPTRALLTAVEPGMQVADFCAGAGGKTLVLGALMRNRGRVLALDVSAARLDRAATRVARAGLHNVERRVLAADADQYTRRHRGRFDRVLVDAPCTGIGAWRRAPDARHRYGEEDLAGIVATQDAILARAARLTRPGGRLVYVTCSLLAEENEERVAALLRRRSDYRVLPVGGVWSATVAARGGGVLPQTADTLRLDPDGFGTDGFFVAVLERSADASTSS